LQNNAFHRRAKLVPRKKECERIKMIINALYDAPTRRICDKHSRQFQLT
jgi:hypothetical protein